MTGYRPTDSKREEFRKYIERCGVMDALTRVLVSLYEETDKPEDALEYLRKQLGDAKPSVVENDSLRLDLDKACRRIEELELENRELKKKLYGDESTDSGSEKVAESLRKSQIDETKIPDNPE